MSSVTTIQEPRPQDDPHVYFFGNGQAEAKGGELSKNVLGGKGLGFMEMTSIGLPIPGGFTITIQTCEEYYKLGRKFPKGLEVEVKQALAKLEKATGKKLGDPKDPLLVSVRSGAARSMPGMFETILNLGLNDKSVEGLAAKTGNPRFAYDSYRLFIQMYSTTAMGLSREPMEHMLHEMKHKLGVKTNREIPADSLKELCQQFKAFYKEKKGAEFPQDPLEQLWGAIKAVFGSWEAEKSVTYRRVEKITDLKGTAVNIVQMIYGNKGDNSGTGICFTRDPISGENTFYGYYFINAQGEDVVADIRNPQKISTLHEQMPDVYDQLCAVCATLESYYKEMQDLEFTIEEGKFYMLQCRTGKRSLPAGLKIAWDMVREGLIDKAQARHRLDLDLVLQSLRSRAACHLRERSPDYQSRRLGAGIPVVPGRAWGPVALTPGDFTALAQTGRRPILLVQEIYDFSEFSQEDIRQCGAMVMATGGKTSDGAIIARQIGLPCIVGVETMRPCPQQGEAHFDNRLVRTGETITVDAFEGNLFIEHCPASDEELRRAIATDEELSSLDRMLKDFTT